jgi:crotonobetainyl-CoA:carnitine CoA-transferase CaiB-like acyl-CoA transferase
MPRVLDEIRVIDYRQYIPGPLTDMLLANQGANIIRIDGILPG